MNLRRDAKAFHGPVHCEKHEPLVFIFFGRRAEWEAFEWFGVNAE